MFAIIIIYLFICLFVVVFFGTFWTFRERSK